MRRDLRKLELLAQRGELRAYSAMDPFSKTSFDALLESLVEIETGTSTVEPVLSDGRPDAFPGFPGLGTAGPQVMQMAQQEVATHQALYAQIMQQQQRLESVAQEFSRFQQPTVLAASTSAPTSPLASMHQRAASPAVPQHNQLGASIAARSGTAMRLSLDGRTLMNSAGLNSNSMAGVGPMQFSAPAPAFGADPAYLSDGQLPSQRLGNASKPLSPSGAPCGCLLSIVGMQLLVLTHHTPCYYADSESLPSPFPRASLQNLGVVSSHSDDFHVVSTRGPVGEHVQCLQQAAP